MSLYGALFSGVSGLSAQSSAMAAISDNVSNVNTIGYKGTSNQFQTLVTKQVSLTRYSPGGVQSSPRANIDVQGLLSSTNSSTDLGVSGSGFFVVNEAANPVSGNRWAYTRAGSFKMDASGYLVNSGGFYLQAWSLLPHDNSENASTVVINGMSYMKAYQDTDGNTTYINDNIIDNRNLKPINLNTIGGSATPTKQIKIGANLPAGEPVYDPSNPDAGGLQSVSVLIYDSLGNAHNVNFEYTKSASNAWNLDAKMPSGAATQVIYSDREVQGDLSEDVYAARAQIEFSNIPQNHSIIKITDNNTSSTDARTYVFEFTTDGTTTYAPEAGEEVISVNIGAGSGVVIASDAVAALQVQIDNIMPSANRFMTDGNILSISQSLGGASMAFDCSACLETIQSAAKPDPVTGIPTGQFTLPAIDWAYKNVGCLNFTSTDPAAYVNNTIIIDNQVYEFETTANPAVNGNAIAVNIDSAISGGKVNATQLVNELYAQLSTNAREANRFIASGSSLEIQQSTTGSEVMINTSDNRVITFTDQDPANYLNETITLGGRTYEFVNTLNPQTVPGSVTVNLDDITAGTSAPQQIMNMLKAAINDADTQSARFQTNTLQPNTQSIMMSDSLFGGVSAGMNALVTGELAGDVMDGVLAGGGISGQIKSYGSINPSTFGTSPVVLSKKFTFNGEPESEDGALAPAIRFNSDGTPKYINVSNLAIEWANGAEDMIGSSDYGDKISIFNGNANTNDGFTHLSGDFVVNYISQDGAKFGNFSGISIGQDGIVTALFDNGDTRPIGQIPLATFTNANGMEGLTGNAWIETDFSGTATLRTAGQGGAGTINSATLESSTVDLGEEFATMITTQRAYSAAAKIITTADEMLDELIRIKR